jgi:hypothetical protein
VARSGFLAGLNENSISIREKRMKAIEITMTPRVTEVTHWYRIENSWSTDADGNYVCAMFVARDGNPLISAWQAVSVCGYIARVKLFYTGPVVNAEMLVMMLEKHGIAATQAFVDDAPDDGDLSRPARVFVPEADYDRAHQLFYAEREDEL